MHNRNTIFGWIFKHRGFQMNLEKFTDRAKGFLQSAQTVAIRMNHQRITPLHILKALLEDNQGMAAQLIQRAGGSGVAIAEVDTALGKIPAVSGGGAQSTPGLDNDAVRALDQAEQLAEKAGDSFVPVQRLLEHSPCRTMTQARRSSPPVWMRSRSKRRSRKRPVVAAPTVPAPRKATTR